MGNSNVTVSKGKKGKNTEEEGKAVVQATEEDVTQNTDDPSKSAPSVDLKTGKGGKGGKDGKSDGNESKVQERTNDTPETVQVQGNEFVTGDTFDANSILNADDIKDSLPSFMSDNAREKLTRAVDALVSDVNSSLQSYAEAARILQVDSLETFNSELDHFRQIQSLDL